MPVWPVPLLPTPSDGMSDEERTRIAERILLNMALAEAETADRKRALDLPKRAEKALKDARHAPVS